jgi:2',3'-cyclic-nucleotide 2'-phosphodiesterase / 3'-nucleotidase / 5'-nucleotidase
MTMMMTAPVSYGLTPPFSSSFYRAPSSYGAPSTRSSSLPPTSNLSDAVKMAMTNTLPLATATQLLNPKPKELIAFFMNDVHSNYGPFAKAVNTASTMLEMIQRHARDKAEQVNTLVVTAGDMIIAKNSTPQDTQILKTMADLINNLSRVSGQPVFSAPGNHEFDGGAETFSNWLDMLAGPILASNLLIPQDNPAYKHLLSGKLKREPVIHTLQNGQKIGIIGITVPSLTQFMSKSADLKGLNSFDEEKTIHTVLEQSRALHQQGINRFALISHGGFAFDQKLSAALSKIDPELAPDMIFGGHSHTELDGLNLNQNVFKAADGENQTSIFQTGKDSHNLGVVVTDLNGKDGDIQKVTANHLLRTKPAQNTPLSPSIQSILDQDLGPSPVLAKLDQTLNTEGARSGGEDAFINKVLDVTAKQLRDAGYPIDGVLMRSPEVRSNLEQGAYTLRDAQKTLPFNDPLVLVTLTGKAIRSLFAQSALCIKDNNSHPGVIHPEGFRYSFNPNTGKLNAIQSFDRSTNTWSALLDDRKYTIATGEFGLKTPEFDGFKQPLSVEPLSEKRSFQGSWIQYLQSFPTPPTLSFELDDRIDTMGMKTPYRLAEETSSRAEQKKVFALQTEIAAASSGSFTSPLPPQNPFAPAYGYGPYSS